MKKLIFNLGEYMTPQIFVPVINVLTGESPIVQMLILKLVSTIFKKASIYYIS